MYAFQRAHPFRETGRTQTQTTQYNNIFIQKG